MSELREERRIAFLARRAASSRSGRTYTAEPDVIAKELTWGRAVQAADTVLLTVPNQLGVEYNARPLGTIAREVAPALGWIAKRERGARA